MSSLGWRLSRPKFFDKFKSKLNTNVGTGGNKPEALGFICDDVYFLWRSSTKTIVKAVCSDIWRTDETIEVPYEEWSLSSPIPFNVTNIDVRKRLQETCLLWGPSGIAAVTFPSRKGSSSLIAGSVILGERIYVEHPRLSIIQAKWHPNTRKDIVLVLNNDYFIRCYDLEDPAASFSVICAGPASSIPFNYSQLSVGLSEPPVDFELGPHLYNTDQWPVFVLKSSGALSYLLMKLIESTKRCHWEPERIITLSGVFEDVFELPTALCLCVSKSFPLVITIGSLSGKLYHSVLSPLDTETHDFHNMEGALVSGETTLFVKEILDLDLGTEAQQLSFVKLIPDPLCPYRYACIHEGGIHVVTMNFMPHMLSLLEGKNVPEVDTASTCRYVLCCANEKKNKYVLSSSSFSNSIPQKFITISGTGETLVYDIPKYPGPTFPADSAVPLNSSSTGIAQVIPDLKALETLTSLLNKNVNQPYLSCTEDSSPEKRESLLMDSMRTLEREYIQKQEQAIEFLTVTLSYLQEKLEDMTEPLNNLVELQPALRGKVEEIAEKYEEENDVEEVLRKRLEKVLLKQHQVLPVMTDAEKAWLRKLEVLQEEMSQMKEQVDGLKGKLGSGQLPPPSPLIDNRKNPSSRTLICPYELLKIKKEILEHQKELTELTSSFHQVEGSIEF